ncbi:ribosome biogenesis protein SSF2, putative [Cryptosporidium muris RN66]|uniref:Ribosome biogenesis protein SSF2, putative n=1 Tax=Cryptosporidium muris (strain RN66) TaxID=441375 RepID=B6AC37_CRYMR|nr:ribosome biogenesis protein SSF2, putative [Cryptosporidium muris RN66]EEA05390.1 ribosome biogenesis protein SSF2, putative [Cryptosporidium muris RN66]|eukprot:XP_002139739.1 ribosome biogenesis protein SSF2 [Cryptosporidium muris RN66]
MPRVHGRRKKTRTHRDEDAEEELKSIPKCFVLRRGKVMQSVKQLIIDLRYLMSPWSSLRLKEQRANKLKDFISIAGPLGISHMLILSQTNSSLYLRLVVLPAGPTLTFCIENFCLMHDVRSSQKRPRSCKTDYLVSPLLVMNGLKNMDIKGTSLDLVQATIIGMFPAIDLAKTQIRSCRRVVLIDYDKDMDKFELRHYAIIRYPAGVSRAVKRLLLQTSAFKLQSIGRSADIADYILSNNTGSSFDSEVEDAVEISIPKKETVFVNKEKIGLSEKGGSLTGKVSVSLKELGPRITMKLVKIVDEVCEGAVLYHRFVKKTQQELDELAFKEGGLKKKRRDLREAILRESTEQNTETLYNTSKCTDKDNFEIDSHSLLGMSKEKDDTHNSELGTQNQDLSQIKDKSKHINISKHVEFT